MIIQLMLMYKALRRKLILAYYKIYYKEHIYIGKNIAFRNNLTININKGIIEIGDNCFFNNGCSLHSHKRIRIGNDCIFGENVKIYDHNHIYRDPLKPINMQGFTEDEINIGNNCWFGTNVVILKGVNIGNHCVIGAGCVISENLPSNAIVTISKKSIEKRIIT